MHKLFNAFAKRIFALYRREGFIDLLRGAMSRVVDQITEIVLLLQLDLSVYVCHHEDLLQLRDFDACSSRHIERFVYKPLLWSGNYSNLQAASTASEFTPVADCSLIASSEGFKAGSLNVGVG